MQATLTADETPVVDGFEELLDRQRAPQEELSRTRVLELHAELDEAGWLDAGQAEGELAQPFWVLAALAEAAGARDFPLPYPLLETWVARRALGDAWTGDGVLTLAPGGFWGETPGPVPYAALADVTLVPVGAELVLVERGDVEVRRGVALDDTLPIGTFELGAAPAVATLDAAAASALRAQYLTLQAAEMVGCAERLFRRTIAYLKDREQFGRRLAAFQALQHRAADLLVNLETARSLTYYAAWVCEVHPEASESYALMAKGFAGERCWEVANEAIQLHGGIGFTWEAGLQYGTGRIAVRSLSALDTRRCAYASGMEAIRAGRMLGLLEGDAA